MQKTVVRNPNQSPIRRNLLNIAGITVQGETIAPQNGDRLLGGYGVAWLNNQDAASQTTGQDNPLPECNCESGGGGGGSGGGGGVQPSGNCEKKNISELKQVLDDYAAQSFCDKDFPNVNFSTFLGYDKPPSDSTAKEIELRMLCPVDTCSNNEDDYENYCFPDTNPFKLEWTDFYIGSDGYLGARVKRELLYTTLESAIEQYHSKSAEVYDTFQTLLAAATAGKNCNLTITREEWGCGEFVNCCERVGKKLYYTPYNSNCGYGYVTNMAWTGFTFPCAQNTRSGSVTLTANLISSNNSQCRDCC